MDSKIAIVILERMAHTHAMSGKKDCIVEAAALRMAAMRLEQMQEATQQINVWAQAYPDDMFLHPSPEDRAEARKALKAIGLTIDQFNANAMRHVIKTVAQILKLLS
jgi:CRISPR/Cas system-associated endonuclease Cas3-HD